MREADGVLRVTSRVSISDRGFSESTCQRWLMKHSHDGHMTRFGVGNPRVKPGYEIGRASCRERV